MVRTRTSPAGSAAGAVSDSGRTVPVTGRTGGFTLLELLVVLAIIGFAATLIPGFVLRDGSSTALDRAAQAVADGLRAAQSRAVLENREVTFAIDAESRQFRAGETAIPVQIGGDIGLVITTARSEQASVTAGRIRFFSDGSATGGRIVLIADPQERTVEVDWLTGDIAVSRRGSVAGDDR